MTDRTLRWRAATRVTYSRALLALTEHAREHPVPDFSFGPLDLARLEAEGLAVSGSDLSGVASLLSTVPGLVAESA